MSRLQSLKKQVTRESALIGGGVVAAFVLMMGTGYLSEGAIQRKNMAQSQFTQSESQLGMMRGQINKSDDAEKRYIDIRLDRNNDNFLNDTDELKELLKQMKEQYRLSDNMRLTISADKVSERPEFQALNYKVIVRDDMEITTGAISDVHLFSFLQDMNRRMPGVIRIKSFSMTRKSNMSFENLAQLSSGSRIEMTDGTIKFTWLTLEDKNPPKPAADDGAVPAAPPQGGM